ncbi:hypothetical protein [Nocardia salmonicida]|uniref:hypothetical protein n=1 Tax=Nocardia salmonicida TaxID=53431 RepID=UPI001041DD6C|nr:hypothetical protein [Nocardia salmonicida]
MNKRIGGNPMSEDWDGWEMLAGAVAAKVLSETVSSIFAMPSPPDSMLSPPALIMSSSNVPMALIKSGIFSGDLASRIEYVGDVSRTPLASFAHIFGPGRLRPGRSPSPMPVPITHIG